MKGEENIKETNIYEKIFLIQEEISNSILKKNKTNEHQGYKYFTEGDCLELIKPLLRKQKLIILFDDEGDLFYEKTEKEWVLRYKKRMQIIDSENGKKILFSFWAAGQDYDIAKAKGKAETYSIKYALAKIFLLHTSEDDPDNEKKNNKDNKSFFSNFPNNSYYKKNTY